MIPGHFLHGSRYGYQRKKCRCDFCKAWQTGRMRRYYERHPEKKRVGWHSYNNRRNYATEAI